MADIKLIATDLDGTFMYDVRTPHPDNVKALMKCKQHGIAFCVCTGRNWHGIRDLMAQVPFEHVCVINNGAAIYDCETNTLRYRNRFSSEVAGKIIELSLGFKGAHIHVSTTDCTHVLDDGLHGDFSRRWAERANNPIFKGALIVHDTVKSLLLSSNDDIQRITIDLDINDVKTLASVYDTLSTVSGIEITSGAAGNMEISAKDGTKAEALSVLADIFNVEPQNVLALGDNYNDMHMLLWAGTGVAMGNADERLKSIADYVTDTNVNAGVAKAIEKIVFQNNA